MILYERLLELIADRPEGELVDLSNIRREFTPSIAEISAAILRLIEANRLDGLTLRRKHPIKPEMPAAIRRGQSREGVPSSEIWAEIEAERQRRGMSREAASMAIWGRGSRGRLSRLRESETVRARTAERIRNWIRNETPARPSEDAGPAGPPRPEADKSGGGASAGGDHAPAVAEEASPPNAQPISLERLAECFSPDFETLRAVAQRFGASSPNKIVRYARMLLERGIVEQSRPASGQPFCLWRRAMSPLGLPQKDLVDFPPALVREISKPAQAQIASAKSGYQRKAEAPLGDRRYAVNREDNRGASRKARKAPSASSSGDAKRIEDRAPTQEPAPAVAPAARARRSSPEPRIARIPPISCANEGQGFQRQAQKAMRTNRKLAEAFIDSGKTSAEATSVSLRIEARKVEARREQEARLLDPIEQAKTILRRRYSPVVSAEICGGPEGHFVVGRKTLTRAEFLAMAERLAA